MSYHVYLLELTEGNTEKSVYIDIKKIVGYGEMSGFTAVYTAAGVFKVEETFLEIESLLSREGAYFQKIKGCRNENKDVEVCR